MTKVCLNLAKILHERNLQPADRGMGIGPFEVRVRPYKRHFKVAGPQVFSGIREMYARDVYLHGGVLGIEPGDVVVDLGANMGNFTCLALAADPDTRVVAVEPSRSLNDVFALSVGLNPGYLPRVRLIRAFVGEQGEKQYRARVCEAEDYGGAPFLTEEDLLGAVGPRVDFLKCDIEGSEFGLLKPGSLLLSVTRKLACEVHAFAGDVTGFVKAIRQSGFEILHLQRDEDGTSTFLARRQ